MTQKDSVKLPHDAEAELDLLARIFDAGGGQIHMVADTLRPEHFYDKRNEYLYAAALALVDSGQPVTAGGARTWLHDRNLLDGGGYGGVTVRERLLSDVQFHAPELKSEDAAVRIRRMYALRSLITTSQRIAKEATGDVGDVEEFCETAEARLHAINQELKDGVAPDDLFSIYDMVGEMARDMQGGKTRDFVTTGFSELDEDLGGLDYEFVTVFGAPTNWGKTNLVVMVADESDRAGKNHLIVSFEDPPKLYAKRFTARRNGISAYGLKNYNLSTEDFGKLEAFATIAGRDYRKPFVLRAKGRPIESVVRRVKRICDANDIDLVVWDYLQAAKCKEKLHDKRERVEFCAREMTDCTKAVGAAGLLISQFRRMEPGEEPTIHTLKESGDIENGAESVILGFNDKQGVPRIRLAKNKDGSKNIDYSLRWDAKSASFLPGNRIEDAGPRGGARAA